LNAVDLRMEGLRPFRFRAEVDWIEWEVVLQTPSNAQTIRRHGRFTFVEAIDPREGAAATIFRFRIHDPKTFRSAARRVDDLEPLFPMTVEPRLSGIEVSFDAYPANSEDPNAEAMSRMAADWFKFLTHPVSPKGRFAGRWVGDVEPVPGGLGTARMLAAGRVLVIGDRNDDLMQRIYVKKTDASTPLPPHQHRARIEVAMRNIAVPCASMAEGADFRFETLAPYFRFRRLKDDLDSATAYGMARATQLGARRHRRTRTGGKAMFGAATRADLVMNKAAREALRELTRRWRLT